MPDVDISKKNNEEPLSEMEQARLNAENATVDSKIVTFEDGFTWKSVFGAIFLLAIMMPGGIYLSLTVGQSLGSAAEWVTIILFTEISRRSFIPLKKQEIYILYLVAAMVGGTSGPFGSWVHSAYLINSAPYQPFAHQIPSWAQPPIGSEAYLQRSLYHPDWAKPFIYMLCIDFLGRVSWWAAGYTLFRITSDIEQLPFPMAPIAASGATALSEIGKKEESWRWNVFSTGSVIGIIFGFFYAGVPIITGTMFGKAIEIFPIPFLDLTPNTESILPTAFVGLTLSLGIVLTGFVIPYEIVLGSFISGILCQVFLNPVLYHNGFFPNWIPGSSALRTQMAINLDFWMSLSIGVQFAIAAIGISSVVKTLWNNRKVVNKKKRDLTIIPKGRGDAPLWTAIAAWAFALVSFIILCRIVVPDFPFWIVIAFGLIWTPVNSYVSARMIGITGRGVGFPLVRQIAVIASGYQKVDIWMAPLPLEDYGHIAQTFREIELTGTSFWSVIKAKLFVWPLILIASFAFWQFFWSSGPIPSAQYPFIQKMWPIGAQSNAIWMQINLPNSEASQIIKNAIKPPLIGAGFGITFVLYAIIILLLKQSPLFFYGFLGGFTGDPPALIPMMLGAWLGRTYFRKRFGETMWPKYTPVLIAGFSCGSGLIAMACVAVSLIAKSVSYLPF